MDTAYLIIISSLLSGLIGVITSIIYYKRHEAQLTKISTLKDFAANRNYLSGKEFTHAINEIFVVFHDSPKVLRELEDFHQIIITKQQTLANDKLMVLFKTMCEDVNINTSALRDSFFLTPFNVIEGIKIKKAPHRGGEPNGLVKIL